MEQEEEADGAGVVEDTGADEEGQGEWGAGAARAEADAEVEAERELRQRARQRLLSAGDLPPQEWARIGLPAVRGCVGVWVWTLHTGLWVLRFAGARVAGTVGCVGGWCLGWGATGCG